MRFAAVAIAAVLSAAVIGADQPEAVKPLPSAEIEKLVKSLGSDNFNTRQEAEKTLVEQGENARKALEQVVASSKDAEQLARAKSILKKIDMPRDLAKLTPERRELATMKIKRMGGLRVRRIGAGAGAMVGGGVAVGAGAGGDDAAGADAEADEPVEDNPDSFSVDVRGKDSNTIVNMGNTRLIIEGVGYSGRSSSTMQIRGGGSSRGQAGEFHSSYSNGVAKFQLHSLDWEIHDASTLKIGDLETKLGAATLRRAIFVDAKGKVLHNVEVPVETTKKEEAKK